MPAKIHPRRWHAGSLFGPGPRRPLDREQRARFRFLTRQHRSVGRISANCVAVAEALLRRLGADGQCDPCHGTLASDAACAPRTVRRALVVLRALGLVAWERRLERRGWRAEQISNSYLLCPNGAVCRAPACGGHYGRGILQKDSTLASAAMLDASSAAIEAARQALDARRMAVEARLLGNEARFTAPTAPSLTQ